MAKNQKYGKQIVILLLEQRGSEVRITEEVVKISPESFDEEGDAL